MKDYFKSICLVVLLTFFIGCSSKPQPYTHVITAETNYYLSGPQQGRPPEGKFKTGTKIMIVSDSGSYVLVKSEEGIEAHVSKGSLKKID